MEVAVASPPIPPLYSPSLLCSRLKYRRITHAAAETSILMSHVTNDINVTWVMSQTRSCVWHDSLMCVTWLICDITHAGWDLGINESCHKWVVSHVLMSHVTNESCHKWVMSQMSHVTHINESCHKWVMSHILMSHVTHMNETRYLCRGWNLDLPPHRWFFISPCSPSIPPPPPVLPLWFFRIQTHSCRSCDLDLPPHRWYLIFFIFPSYSPPPLLYFPSDFPEYRRIHAAAATSICHRAAVACRRASRQWTGAELAPFRVCLSASAVVYAVTGRYSQKSALQPFYIVHSVVSLLLRISTYTPLCEPTRSRVNISKVSSLPYFVCMTWLHYQIYYMSTRTVPYLSLRERGRLCGHR